MENVWFSYGDSDSALINLKIETTVVPTFMIKLNRWVEMNVFSCI